MCIQWYNTGSLWHSDGGQVSCRMYVIETYWIQVHMFMTTGPVMYCTCV